MEGLGEGCDGMGWDVCMCNSVCNGGGGEMLLLYSFLDRIIMALDRLIEMAFGQFLKQLLLLLSLSLGF